jgi:3-deoxy-manno-octulosonate cytidylyltransferase (CMP-KDO synthetase)
MSDEQIAIATTSEPITSWEHVADPNTVKVVTNEIGDALYFSRAPIPFQRDGQPLMSSYRKHTGLYVYRRETLLEFTGLPPSPLERMEKLEQLRALENGMRIRVVPVEHSSIGVDTAEDLERVRGILRSK